jgi:2-keto-4-pentenoate hydratase/2-oxohepta-3-ene-1,7-dioic acid hydratase in catechol pathway
MRLIRFDGGRIGIVAGERVIDASDIAGVEPGSWPPVGMVRTIAAFDRLRPRLEERAATGQGRPLGAVRLDCPIDWPNKIIAFPANYRDHIAEMKAETGLISAFDAAGQGFFLKANSSLSGPADPILVPDIPGREVHHESELAVIVGRECRHVPRDAAMAQVFGYACLVDVVVRGREERVMRKSFDSFCPLGPWIVTADEVPDPRDIAIRLSINGEPRQDANTRDLIVDIPEMIALASSVMTLFPGDVIASGTPAGVGPMRPGDALHIEAAGVGSMDLRVVRADAPAHRVWRKD